MPQMTVRRPLGKLDLRHQLGSKPAAVFHICSCEAYVSPIASRFREICERAALGLNRNRAVKPFLRRDQSTTRSSRLASGPRAAVWQLANRCDLHWFDEARLDALA
jgi:hypothetical protein